MDDGKTYTYGYNVGWNVENAYLEEQKSILEKYNEQIKKVEYWRGEKGRISRTINRLREELTEENLKKQYIEDQIRMPFSSYVNEYRDSIIRKERELNIDYDRAIDNYNANLYYLIEIKNQTGRAIYARRNELDLRLKQLKIREEQLSLMARPRYDENHNVVNSEELMNFRVESDNIFLERKKLEHALEEVGKMEELIEFTEEEGKLMLRGLNPREKEIYKEIDNDPQKTIPTDGDDLTDDKDDAIAKYEEALAKYEQLLSEYNQELEQLYQLQHQYENDEIDYKQYLEFGNHMLERYDFIEKEYQKLLKLKSEIEASHSLENEELNKKLKDLEQQLEDWRYYAAHLGNGMDPVNLEELENKIKKTKEKLNRRNNLKNPTPPQKPVIINQKTKEEETEVSNKKNYTIEEILAKIGYGTEEEEDKLFGFWDNFVYTAKDVKVWNFPKSKAFTILDKPLKLVKSSIGSLVFGLEKVIGKLAYKNSDEVKERIDKVLDRINDLTDEEIEFLANNLTYRAFKELGSTIPKIVYNAIQKKIREKYNGQYLLNANRKIQSMYIAIIEKYKKCADIKEKLGSDSLNPIEKASLQNEFNTYSKQLCNDIVNLMEFRAEVDQKVNLSGAAALDYNNKAKYTQSAGGHNIKIKVQQEYNFFFKRTHISEFLNKGDGFNAAKRFLYGEKLKIANTEEKRTLKNRFAKSRVGAYEFSPLVTIADYSSDTYLKDVLTTLMIISSIGNMVYMKKLKEELANTQAELIQANAQIEAYNLNIEATNKNLQDLQQKITELTNKQNVTQGELNQLFQDISNANQTIMSNNKAMKELQNIFGLYSADPEAFVNHMIEFTKRSVGTDHGYSEYYTMTAEAGQKGTGMLMSNGTIYNAVDQANHNFSAELLSKLENIQGDTSLSSVEKAKLVANVFNDSSKNLSAFIDTLKTQALDYISNYGGNWDLSAFEAVMNSAATYDSAFVSDVFNGFVEAAMKADSLKTIELLTPTLNLPTIDLEVPGAIETIKTIALDIPQVSLVPAIATLTSVVGKAGLEAVTDEIKRENKGKTLFDHTKEMTDNITNLINDTDIDMASVAKDNYESAKEEWDSKGPFYRLFHQKEKPKNLDYYIDALKEENKKGGYSL